MYRTDQEKKKKNPRITTTADNTYQSHQRVIIHNRLPLHLFTSCIYIIPKLTPSDTHIARLINFRAAASSGPIYMKNPASRQ